MKKITILIVVTLLFSIAVKAQPCPEGYVQIYELCNKKETAKCVLADRQQECSDCWEIHFAACEGSKSGGMRKYSTYQEANQSAERDKAVDNSCPWYNDQIYRIVLNDPKNCLHSPTGNEMVSAPGKEGSGEIDDLLQELLKDSSIANDASVKQDWEKVQKETKEELSKPTTSSQDNQNGNTPASTQKVGTRGLAGKIQSGEYDPYSKKEDSKNSESSTDNNREVAKNDSTGNQESYAIFWIRKETMKHTMSPQIIISLNGQAILAKPGAVAVKVLNGTITGAPSCDAQDNCYVRDDWKEVGWCQNIIRVKLTQKQNTWMAEEQHGAGPGGRNEIWRGSFTAKPGCNIIEIK